MHLERNLPIARALALGLALCGALAGAPAAHAVDELNLSNGITAEGAPLALRGHDPVAYFAEGVPTRGSAARAVVHEGATYYFASEENRKRFRKDPARYAPAYGGFCAYGVSVGKKFDGDPRFWTISDGRLFLNLNADIAKQFGKDVPGAVRKAERQWATIQHTAVGEL